MLVSILYYLLTDGSSDMAANLLLGFIDHGIADDIVYCLSFAWCIIPVFILLWLVALKDCINSDRSTGTKIAIIIFGYTLCPILAFSIYLFKKLLKKEVKVVK